MIWKLVGILVLVIGVVLSVPSLRQEVRPQIEYVLRPVYKWNTKNRVNEIHRTLDRQRAMGQPVPNARTFSAFLEQEEGKGAAQDAWGEPYFLLAQRKSYRVGSKGPDRLRGTPDDILSNPVARTAGP